MGHRGSSVGAAEVANRTSNIVEWDEGITQTQDFLASLFRGTYSGRYAANGIDVETREKNV